MANLAAGPHDVHGHGYVTNALQRRPDGTWRNCRQWLGKPYFEALQYAILFPIGDGGWYDYTDKVYARDALGNIVRNEEGRAVVQLAERVKSCDLQGNVVTFASYMKKRMFGERLWKCGTLAQQYVLDMYAAEQGCKLWFEKQRQASRRIVNRQGVEAQAAARGTMRLLQRLTWAGRFTARALWGRQRTTR